MEQNNRPLIVNRDNSDEIDITELLKKLWIKRGFIIKMTALFFLIGIFIALFSPVQYTSTCTVVPQSGTRSSSGGLGSVAAMMGVNLGTAMMNEGTLSPAIYPQIIKSVPFTREIMKTEVIVEKSNGQPITLYEYYSDKKYRDFNLLSAVKKYTIGLPGVILSKLRSNKEPVSVEITTDAINDSSSVYNLSRQEKSVYNAIQASILLNSNAKDGYVTLGYTFPEAVVAAQVADKLYRTVEEYVSQFKSEKQKDNLLFVEQSYESARKDFLEAQNRLTAFQDANRGLTTASAQSTEALLRNEYDIAYTVYRQLATQLEQAKIAVKENQTILTLVNPPIVPLERSAPRRSMILTGFLLFGLVVSTAWVFVAPYLKDLSKEIKTQA